jgi:bifunctional DNA-binding transcriptional regulator/antitoxin component of YhaV-PrlF toxin-antitoxin module
VVNPVSKAIESKLVKAIKRSDSLRTTVPSTVVDVLGVDAGDSLRWTLDPKGSRVIVSKSQGDAATKK